MTEFLRQIVNPISGWYKLFLDEASVALGSTHPYLNELVKDGVINFQGKHMRPVLTMLIAKTFQRDDIENIISSAVSIELVHIASLIHDDILDEASMRHNVPTANNVIGPHAAVLAGDYVLAKGVYYSISKGNRRSVDILVDTMEQLVEGELRQKKYSDNLDIDKDGYFKVISLKTSCLISAASRLGAPIKYDSMMNDLGQNIGAAFQIKDDMLDIWNKGTGKNMYNDFKERKITLPLIYAIDDNPSIIDKVKKMIAEAAVDKSASIELADIVKSSNALYKLNSLLKELETKSIEIIDHLPDSDARDSLYQFVKFVARRDF